MMPLQLPEDVDASGLDWQPVTVKEPGTAFAHVHTPCLCGQAVINATSRDRGIVCRNCGRVYRVNVLVEVAPFPEVKK